MDLARANAEIVRLRLELANREIMRLRQELDQLHQDILLERHSLIDRLCCICLGSFDGYKHIARIPCQHVYHISCLQSLMRYSMKCPLCRQEFQRGTRVSVVND